MKQWFRAFKKNNKGIGVVELILILVILVALVLIFKNQIMGIVSSMFGKIGADSKSITEVSLTPTP